MIDVEKVLNFEWDSGNIDKSYTKHKITPNEAEEVFLDKAILIFKDTKHSIHEERFEAIGRIVSGSIVFLVYTIRKDKIRIISTRKANKKERRQYEEI